MFLNGKMTYLGSDIIGKNVSHTLSKTEFFFFSFLFLCSRIVGQRSMLMVDAFRIPQEKKKKKRKRDAISQTLTTKSNTVQDERLPGEAWLSKEVVF